ncbi:MAG: glycosyltransferase family 9 protein [Bryobacteraceae bacterium]|nr:glycosyltransferase family 9 protein [Bryobacteraceae bacterium]
MRRLLIRPGAIGDCVTSFPALEALRAAYTEVWVAGPNVALIRFADAVRSIASTGLDMLEIRPDECRTLVDALRGFDSIVSWYGSGRPEFRALVRRLGLPFHFFPALPESAGAHAVDYSLAQATELTAAKADPTPRIRCPREPRDSIVIHPFSGSARKNWPLDRFKELARRLEGRLPVEWCAGPDEPLDGAQRFDDLYSLACWLAGARLYIGNDSGISHLAAAAGAPVVAIFGPTDPAVWAPRGDQVRIVQPPRPGDPIAHVPVEAALEAALELTAR